MAEQSGCRRHTRTRLTSSLHPTLFPLKSPMVKDAFDAREEIEDRVSSDAPACGRTPSSRPPCERDSCDRDPSGRVTTQLQIAKEPTALRRLRHLPLARPESEPPGDCISAQLPKTFASLRLCVIPFFPYPCHRCHPWLKPAVWNRNRNPSAAHYGSLTTDITDDTDEMRPSKTRPCLSKIPRHFPKIPACSNPTPRLLHVLFPCALGVSVVQKPWPVRI